MIKTLKIQVICDNTASGAFLAEHGLSFFIQADDINILFDTGRGFAFKHNINEAKINLEKIDHIIFSHGHYDHTGAISYFFNSQGVKEKINNGKIKIFLHPNALKEKYSKTPNGPKYIGITDKNKRILKKYSNSIVFNSSLEKITQNIKLTGEIPTVNKKENVKTKFYSDKNLTIPDNLLDDKALFFKTSKGIIVLLGCCHSGLANTLDYISKIEKSNKIFAVIGGTHLKNADKTRLDFTIDTLKKYNVDLFAPNHCTGQRSICYIYSKLDSIIQPAPAGTIFNFK